MPQVEDPGRKTLRLSLGEVDVPLELVTALVKRHLLRALHHSTNGSGAPAPHGPTPDPEPNPEPDPDPEPAPVVVQPAAAGAP